VGGGAGGSNLQRGSGRHDNRGFSPKDFLLLLLSGATMDRVFHQGDPLHGLTFSLFFSGWTRLALAEVMALPVLVDVEL
jgi:hypothetical protein